MWGKLRRTIASVKVWPEKGEEGNVREDVVNKEQKMKLTRVRSVHPSMISCLSAQQVKFVSPATVLHENLFLICWATSADKLWHLKKWKRCPNTDYFVSGTQEVHYGLQNQGSTCYLNSVLQVLYMTPEIHNRLDTAARQKLYFCNKYAKLLLLKVLSIRLQVFPVK